MDYTAEIKNIDPVTVEIRGELSAEDFFAFRQPVISELAAEINIAGFRKGQVPEKVLIRKIGEDKILWAMAERAIKVVYPKIIKEKKIEAIGPPEAQITKLAAGNPLGFVIKTTVIPALTLPDYRTIVQKVLAGQTPVATAVTTQEIDDFIDNLRKIEGQSKISAAGRQTIGQSDDLPALNMDFIKKFGDFKSLENFKEIIKNQLTENKKNKNREQTRVAILEAIAKEVEVKLPDILVANELNAMMAELRGQIEQTGLKFDDYLSRLKKTEAELRTTWQADAAKRVKFGLIIQKIAALEEIGVTEAELKQLTEKLLANYPNLKEVKKDNWRHYAANILINEKVFARLEKSGQ